MSHDGLDDAMECGSVEEVRETLARFREFDAESERLEQEDQSARDRDRELRGEIPPRWINAE